MTVYKYFLKLANRYKIYGIIYLVIFMGMALLQISGKKETSNFEDISILLMVFALWRLRRTRYDSL